MITEPLAAVLFGAVGGAAGAVNGVVRPFCVKKTALAAVDTVWSIAAGALYIAVAHQKYSGMLQFWSAAVYCFAAFCAYCTVCPVSRVIVRTLKTLLSRLKKSLEQD